MDVRLHVLYWLLLLIKRGIPSIVNRFDGEINLFQTADTFTVESTVQLSELDKDVGFKVKSTLNVAPVWRDDESEYLLKFNLKIPKLLSKGKQISDYSQKASIWDKYPDTEFYAHWKNGIIIGTYLDATEPTDILNFKKSLVSLFQFNVLDSERNETDVSGICEVQYETVSMHIFKKTKSRCVWVADEMNDEVISHRMTRYTLAKDLNAISEIHAEESHKLREESLEARAWLRLQRVPTETVPPTQLSSDSSHSDALQKLPPYLIPISIAMAPLTEESIERLTAEQLAVLLEKEVGALGGMEPGEGGTVAGAYAVLRLLPVLRGASRNALAALLHDTDPEHLPVLLRLLGLAGTAAAQRAAEQLLQLRHGDASHALAHHYLDGLAHAPEPEEAVVSEVARLGEEVADRGVAASALLAAAAASARLSPASPAPRALRDALARSLARCKDDECRAVRLHALGNMRRADTGELLLEHAERGAGAVALAALDALHDAPVAALTHARLLRLRHVALRPGPLAPRAAALDLLLQRAEPEPPAALLAGLDRAPAELRRLAWQRLDALSARDARWRVALEQLPVELRGWAARATPGSSALLEREAGASGGWRATLQSVQLTPGGLLRRARVSLSTRTPAGLEDDTFAVELWARGLAALAGGGGVEAEGDGEGEEDVAGGLSFAVGGARTRTLTLFESQGELLGHVWAGTGSEPTTVMRALRPLRPLRATLPLLGAGPLQISRQAAVALAMDAQAQVSLWSRNARTSLSLRGAAVAEASAGVSAAGGALRVRLRISAEPRLNIDAHADFYGATAMCVRVATDPYERIHNATLESELGGFSRRVRREARWAGAGRTLSLGALNDVTCTTLGAV